MAAVVVEKPKVLVIVPASSDENVKSGVKSAAGVDIAVTTANDGGVNSITKSGMVKAVYALLSESVTVTVFPVYVPADNELNVIVLLEGNAAATVVLEKGKLLVIIPASVDENT